MLISTHKLSVSDSECCLRPVFAVGMFDPADPTRMLAAYDSGDHLHPGPAGYEAMGNAIDLSLLLGPPERQP